MEIDFIREALEKAELEKLDVLSNHHSFCIYISLVKSDIDENNRPKLKIADGDWLCQLVDEAIKFDQHNYREIANDAIVTLAHIVDPKIISPQDQHQVLARLIDKQCVEGLKWFVAVGFQPSAKKDNRNVLEHLAMNPHFNAISMAKILIGAQENNQELAKQRNDRGLRERVSLDVRGFDELPGNIAKVVIAGLESSDIRLSSLIPSSHGFRHTIYNIFKSKEIRDRLVENYAQRSYANEVERAQSKETVRREILHLYGPAILGFENGTEQDLSTVMDSSFAELQDRNHPSFAVRDSTAEVVVYQPKQCCAIM